MQHFTVIEAPVGSVGIVASAAGLSHVHLLKSRGDRAVQAVSRLHPDAQRDEGLLPGLQEEIGLYFSGEPMSFSSVVVDLGSMTRFQQRVLKACARIEYGRTVSYAELARRVGCPAGARAVGGALGRNPVPLVIPCHRVVASDGSLGGFSAEQGVGLKRLLLDMEARALVPA